MLDAINFMIGWNPNEEFLCVVCGLPVGEPISHLKMHMTQTDFHCIDCDVKCGELKAGYDSFVNHVEQTRHLNYQFTCMECNISETDFPKHMRHLQMHNDEYPTLHDIKTESDAKKHSVNLGEDPRLLDIKTEDDDVNRECSGMANPESGEAEAIEIKPVQLQDYYKVVQLKQKSGKFRFICKLCKLTKSEANQRTIRKHIQLHEDMAKQPIVRTKSIRPLYTFDTCRICKEQHASQASLFDHVLEHFPDSLFFCRVCFELYNDYQSCKDHFNSHELEVNEKTTFGVYFLCSVCGHFEIPNDTTKMIRHLTEPKGCGCGNGAFVCRASTANLLQFEHCCIKFDDTIHSCNFKCDDAVSLCSHVLQHIVSNEVANIGDTGRKELKIHSRLENDSKEIVPSVVKIESPFLNSGGQRTFRKASVVQESVRTELKIHSRLENDSKEIVPSVVKIKSSLLNSERKTSCTKTSWDQQTVCKETNWMANSTKSLTPTLTPRLYFHDYMMKNSCAICGTICMIFSDLFEHILNHFTNNVFYCRGCFKTFSRFMSANIHSAECGIPLSHRGNKAGVPVGFICSICGHNNVCNQKQDIISHVLQHHEEAEDIGHHLSPETSFACKRVTVSLRCYIHVSARLTSDTVSCDETFDNVQSLCTHVQQHIIRPKGYDGHTVSGSSAQTKAVKGEKAEDRETRVESGRTEAESLFEEVDEFELQALALMHNISRTSTGESKCVLCEMVLSPDKVSSHVNWHMRNTTVAKGQFCRIFKFTCKLCNLVLLGEYRQNLRHLLFHENEPLPCHICKEMYHSEAHLFHHVLRHYPETLFYCRICFRTFNDFSACKQHYLRHKVPLGEEFTFGIYFQCPVCGELETADPNWKIIHHLSDLDSHGCNWENGTFVSNPRKGAFVCRNLTAKLSGYEHSHAAFDEITCDFQCDDASTLNSHVQQHALYYKLPIVNTKTSPSTCTLQANGAKQRELCHSSLPKTDDQKSSLKSLKPAEQQTSWKNMYLTTFAPNSETLLNSSSTDSTTFEEIPSVKREVVDPICNLPYGRSVAVAYTSNTSQLSVKQCDVSEIDSKQSEMCQSSLPRSNDQKSPLKSLKPAEQQTSGKYMYLTTFATNSVTLLNSYHANIMKKYCIICRGTSKIKGNMFQHVCIHFPDNIFYCRRCFTTFRNYLSAVKHSMQHFSSCTDIVTHEASTLGFICSLCGYNDVSSQKKFIIAHLFKHYDQAKDPDSCEFDHPQKYFSCRRILASLMCYKYFLGEFDSASCEEKFDNIRSLVDHVQQHIVRFKGKTWRKDSESSSSTDSTTSEEVSHVKREVVEPPCDLPSGRSVAIQFGEANTSNTVGLYAINEEKMESLELIDLNLCTSAKTFQKVIPVHSVALVSVPSRTLTVDPSSSAAYLKPFSNFLTELSAHPKRTFETVFTSDSYHSLPKQGKLKEQESKQSTRKSKIKIFVCKVCGKRFIEEHFLKKHMSKH